MKLRIVTIGKPKLPYAQMGFEEYCSRLKRYHDVTVTHIADKHNDAKHIMEAVKDTTLVALTVDGTQMTSEELSKFLKRSELNSQELSFIIGGPKGLPQEVIDAAAYRLGFSRLTFPHDLAMVILVEAVYRASTISVGHPYHK